MLFHQLYLINLHQTLTRLRFLIDEYCTSPDAYTLDARLLVQRYLNFILMGDVRRHCRIRDVLAPLIKKNRFGKPTPQAWVIATDIEEQMHDALLAQTRDLLSLDEGQSVIEILVDERGDANIVVEEREFVQQLESEYLDREYGQHDVEDHALWKMTH